MVNCRIQHQDAADALSGQHAQHFEANVGTNAVASEHKLGLGVGSDFENTKKKKKRLSWQEVAEEARRREKKKEKRVEEEQNKSKQKSKNNKKSTFSNPFFFSNCSPHQIFNVLHFVLNLLPQSVNSHTITTSIAVSHVSHCNAVHGIGRVCQERQQILFVEEGAARVS